MLHRIESTNDNLQVYNNIALTTYYNLVINIYVHHHHHRFTSTYHASPDMTDTSFHVNVARMFCQNFLHLHQNRRRCGSTRQSIILSTSITIFLIVCTCQHRHALWHPNKQTSKHANKQMYKQTNKHANKQTRKQTNTQTNKHAHRHAHAVSHMHTITVTDNC